MTNVAKYLVAGVGTLCILIIGGFLIAWKMEAFSGGDEEFLPQKNDEQPVHVITPVTVTSTSAEDKPDTLIGEKVNSLSDKPSSISAPTPASSISTPSSNNSDAGEVKFAQKLDNTKDLNIDLPNSTEIKLENLGADEHPNFVKLSRCTNSPFCEAHLQYLAQVKNIIEGRSDSLEVAFKNAKSLFTPSTSDVLLQEVYSSADAKSAALVIYSVDVFEKDFKQSLRDMKPPNSNPIIQKLYELYARRVKLGECLPETAQLGFADYVKERADFINALYKIKKVWFEDTLRGIIVAASFSKIGTNAQIVEWWKLFNIKAEERRLFSEDYFCPAADITDERLAVRFATHPVINAVIDNWLSGDSAKRAQAENVYQKSAPNLVFGLPKTLPETIDKYFTPSPIVPIEKAVINTVPRKLINRSSCYASAYYQSMANFFPSVRDLPLWTHEKTSKKALEQKRIMHELATASEDPVDLVSLMTHALPESSKGSHAILLLDAFVSGFDAEGLSANKLRGFAKVMKDKVHYFPPYSYFYLTAGMPELENLIMIGQLFITFLSADKRYEDTNDERFYQKFDLPMHLNLKVLGSETKKRFELYSFNMCIKMGIPHAVSYVKRANGQWWRCDDLGTNKKVSQDELPINGALQLPSSGYKQRPVFAFYLRVE